MGEDVGWYWHPKFIKLRGEQKDDNTDEASDRKDCRG